MFYKFKYKPQKEYEIEADNIEEARDKLLSEIDFEKEIFENIYCSQCIVDETKKLRGKKIQ